MSSCSKPSASARKRLRLTFSRAEIGRTSLSVDNDEPDPIIDSWYQDPYGRPSGYGPTDDVQRRANLEHAMRSRGFAFNRVHPIVNWLMNCHGRYHDFGSIRATWNGRVVQTKKKDIVTGCPNRPAECDADSLVSEHDNHMQYALSAARSSTSDTEDNGAAPRVHCETDCEATQEIDDFIDFLDEELGGNKEDDKPIDQNTGSAWMGKDDPTLQDEQIARLERRKRFWDIIYGSAELPMPEDDKSFDYLRGVVPTLPRKRWLSSLAGPDLDDGSVGKIGHVDLPGEHSPEDANLEVPVPVVVVGGKPQRKVLSVVEGPRTPDWVKRTRVQLDIGFSHGFRETWKEITSRPAQTAANERSGEAENTVRLPDWVVFGEKFKPDQGRV